MADRWLTNEDLAERYQVPLQTIHKWRSQGTGPRGARFGKHVRYREADVLAWERQRLDHAQAVG